MGVYFRNAIGSRDLIIASQNSPVASKSQGKYVHLDNYYEHRRATRRCRPEVTRTGTNGLINSRSAMPWQMQNRPWLLNLPMAQRAVSLCLAKTEECLTWKLGVLATPTVLRNLSQNCSNTPFSFFLGPWLSELIAKFLQYPSPVVLAPQDPRTLLRPSDSYVDI